ncbi:MAG: isoprenylcysteine carboxyl methyltransferase family protein [Candidatus Kapaibacteriota bacterium]
MGTWVLLGLVALQRLNELILARKNQRWAVAQGGIVVHEAHYWMFFLLHGGWLVATALFSKGPQPWFAVGMVCYTLLQALRYWTIATLGKRWNTRIIVLPGQPLVKTGPFRWLRHPNYMVVVLELALVPIMLGAWYVAAVATVVNAIVLLQYRLPAEEQALREYSAER